MTSPASPTHFFITPATGEGTSTTAFAVSTDNNTSLTATFDHLLPPTRQFQLQLSLHQGQVI